MKPSNRWHPGYPTILELHCWSVCIVWDKTERINAGYCVLSDPLLLAMCGCSDDIKLSIVEAAQEAHFSEIMKLVVLWRCALRFDRKAATSFKVNGMARWCDALKPCYRGRGCTRNGPRVPNDFRVNIAPGNHLVSAAALDVLRLLPDTLVSGHRPIVILPLKSLTRRHHRPIFQSYRTNR